MSRSALVIVGGAMFAVAGLAFFSPGNCLGTENSAGKRYAVLVGVEQYQHPNLRKPEPLKYPIDDATELADVLRKAGYDVTLLTDETGEKNQELLPTKENIDAALAAVLRKCQAADTVLVALSGHGLQFVGHKDAYFCPIDARPFPDETKTLVSVGQLYRDFEKSFAGVKIIVFDACRTDPDPGRGRGLDSDSSPRPPRGVGVLFSASAGQKAWEHDSLKHGVFFHYLIQGLRGEAADSSQEVTFESLSGYVRKNVPRHVKRLYPDREQQPNLKADLEGEPPILARVELLPTKAVVEKALETMRNTVGMELVLIPPGSFRMGSPATESGRDAYEDQVDVTLTKPFYLGKTEVTQREWRSVMGTTPWKKKANIREGDNYAASYVSWEDAQSFCRKLSEKEKGKIYRLPTEAEWEYACRGGTTTAYSFGENKSQLRDYGWYDDDGNTKAEQYAHEVARKNPNPHGLYDMHGNVWEWCEDVWGEKLPGGTDPLFSTGGSFRVDRGGGWGADAASCRSACRGRVSPSDRRIYLGFRVALSPSGE